MDKMGNKLRELNLPKLKLDRNKKLAIFGTGEVAERFLYDISDEYGEEMVEFFIDSRNISNDFHGKKIVKPDFVDKDECKNDRKYLLASFSSTATMKNLLTDMGVSSSNILEPMKKCSVDMLLDTVEIIKNAVMYPVIDSQDKLNQMIKDIEFFIPPDDSEFYVDLYIDFDFNTDTGKRIKVINVNNQKPELANYDIVLIWDSLALCDDDVRDMDNAFCIDSDLLLHQNTKIFGAINNRIIDTNKREYYRNMSLNNWKSLEDKAKKLQKAYVFGSGPSMSNWVYSLEEGTLEDGIRIVCNEFHNSAEIMRIIDPDIYVLFDLAFFGHRLSDSLGHIIEVIRYTKCKLVIPDLYVRMVHCKFGLPDDKLIGIDTSAKNINFPTYQDLRVCKSNNVVCVFSLPIATSLCHEIDIIGCDGRDENFSWGHSAEMIGEETKNGIEQDAKIGADGERRKYNEHCDYMKRIIELGETYGKQYYSLTPSFIPVLRERVKKNKVSIIVPIHNSEEYLEKCLNSLVNQTLKDIEIILVDDASSDTSAQIMVDYQNRYNGMIRCIYLDENVRQGGARNVALKEANGEYIAFVDSDDFVDTEMCEKMYNKAIETNSDIVFCDYYECDAELTKKKWVSTFFRQQTGEIDAIKRKYVFFQKAMCCGKLIRKSIIDTNDIVFPEKIRYEDIAVTLLYSLYAEKIEKVYEPLYYYIQHRNSTSNFAGSDSAMHHMRVDKILFQNLKERGFYDLYREESEAFLIRYSPVITLYEREKNPTMQTLQDIACTNRDFVKNYRNNKYFYCDILEPFYKKCYELLDESPVLLAEEYEEGRLSIRSEDYKYYYSGHLDDIEKIYNMCCKNALKIAIWGGGRKGYSFLEVADPDCRYIYCVIDGNMQKWNSHMRTGHIIKALDDVAEDVDVIIVMNKYYYESVKQEIKVKRKSVKVINLDMYLLMKDDYFLEDFIE